MAGLLLAACSSAEDRKSGSLETIPVADAFGNLQPLKVSDFLGSIRYVALETNDSVLVGEGAHIGLLPDYILVTDENRRCSLTRMTGILSVNWGITEMIRPDMLLRKSGFRDMTERFVSGAGKMSGCGMICRDSFREC